SLSNLKSALINEGFVDITIHYMGELWVLLEFNSENSKSLFHENVGVKSWFSKLTQASNDFITRGRIVWVEIEGIPFKLWLSNTFKRIASKWGDLLDTDNQEDKCFHSKRMCIHTKVATNIFETSKIIFRGKVFWIRAKEVPGWVPDFLEEYDEEDLSDDGSRDVDSKKKNLETCGDDSDLEEVQETVFEEKEESNHNVDENSSGLKENHSEDPFGFTPNEESDTLDVNKEDNRSKIGHTGKSIDLNSGCSGHFKQSEIPCSGGSILNLMEELVKAKKDWVKELCAKHKVNFLALQETKMENMANSTVKMCWGNLAFNFVHSDSVGNDLLIVAVYAPHDLGEKRRLWDYLVHVIHKWHGEVVIIGDLNEVRFKSDRRFDKPANKRVQVDMMFPKSISLEQQSDLELEISKEELKKAVWDCDANLVKDFRPISLIGSLYKIIAKILANRLVGVLGDIVDEVQSAFIADRQILDGPFILNEILQWDTDGRNNVTGSSMKRFLGLIPIFHMSIFRVPLGVLRMLESTRSHFFNGHVPKIKKASWVKWNNVMASKEKGGLGVASLYALNRGLMCKWIWRFYSQNSSLWARVIKAIHGEDGKLLDHMKVKLGNGDKVTFWEDTWNGDKAFKDLYPRIFALESLKLASVGMKLESTSLDSSFRRKPRGGIEQEQFDALADQIRDVILAPTPDRWVWLLEKSRVFSVASIRKMIDDKRLLEVATKTRWIKVVPIKVNVHAWKDNSVGDISDEEFNAYEEWLSWIVNIRLPSKKKMMLEGIFYSMWWHLWSFRNKFIFDNKIPSKAMLFDDIVSRTFYWCRFRCKASFS
nr:RNA-directed DNA polymerase, eukaryota, reverse transcriptase zinc-binding domain protein [Tanacetum cinerariifolium]